MEQVIQCLSAFLGCLGFAFVFRVHRHLPYALLASLGGMLGWIVYLLVIPYLSNIMSNLCEVSGVRPYASENIGRDFLFFLTKLLQRGCIYHAPFAVLRPVVIITAAHTFAFTFFQHNAFAVSAPFCHNKTLLSKFCRPSAFRTVGIFSHFSQFR